MFLISFCLIPFWSLAQRNIIQCLAKFILLFVVPVSVVVLDGEREIQLDLYPQRTPALAVGNTMYNNCILSQFFLDDLGTDASPQGKVKVKDQVKSYSYLPHSLPLYSTYSVPSTCLNILHIFNLR